MLYDLLDKYKEMFNQDIELPVFWELEEQEQVKILEDCIRKNQQISENQYYNDNYMEEVM